MCMLLFLFAGCRSASEGSDPSVNTTDTGSSSSPSTPDLTGRSLKNADSYADIFKALSEANTRSSGNAYGATEESSSAGKAASNATEAAPAADTGSAPDSTSGQGGDYSQTNVQVKGVDEGDIVKTDGQYIYVLRNNELIIFKAEGAATVRISSVKVAADNYTGGPVGGKPESENYTSEYASDIYVTGDIAVVISSYSSYIPYIDNGTAKTSIAYPESQQISKLRIFDISDRTKPILKSELGQDGYVLTTRLIDQTLYMISNHYVYNMNEDDSNTYIPKLYANGEAKLVSVDQIAIMPYFNSTTYTIVCAYDLAAASLTSNQSILGGGSAVYMNKDTLYIAGSTNDQKAGTPYTDSVYTVIDYTTTSVTDITSFDLTGGSLKLKASGSVAGSLYSQFNMDEYNGNLRVVTTTYSQNWSEYTDKAKGFVNYIWKDPISANALYVLDDSLKVVGSIEDLASGEQVYSVRYDGSIGYIVTFRQVDPLFAVDLSDPTKPTVLSALKIAGFSEYLHVYSDGRLFGLGMDANEETGRTTGMKLTMFDTTDPADVTVKHSLNLSTSYSNALYNHKAILISPDKGIIAFPADNGYDIYGYSDEQGFFKRASISSVEWSGDSRGLYIGDFAYIIDNIAITVLNMTDFTNVARITY